MALAGGRRRASRLGGHASGSPPGFEGRPAIAVLAFDNLSGDPEQEYFADGIAEDIITGLALWRLFPVIARNSSFTYKGKSVDVKQVAKDLGVRYVLEGSVRKAGERVRITGQLIDAETGAHIWAERYDRDLTDIFAVQDEITSEIVAHVAPEISLAEAERASRRQATELGAWELFQRGMWHFNRFTSDDNAKARAIFAEATAADPKMALPVAWTAVTHIMDLVLDWSEDRAQSVTACMSTAKRAVALDPREPASHAMLAGALVLHRQPQAAVAEGTHAVKLNPSFAFAHFVLAWALIYAGRPSQAVCEFETASRLSPRDPFLTYFWAVQSLAHIVLREFDAAIDCAQRALRDNPDNVRALHRLACALGHKGDLEAARAALEESRRVLPDPTPEFFEASYPFTDPKDLAFFLDGLRKAGLE